MSFREGEREGVFRQDGQTGLSEDNCDIAHCIGMEKGKRGGVAYCDVISGSLMMSLIDD